VLSSNDVVHRAVERRRLQGTRGRATVATIFEGEGWRLRDIVCNADASDHPFEERHDYVSIALVMAGAFSYRSSAGCGDLCSGSVLLGNPEARFSCSHQHGAGDRCMAFQFSPACYDEVLSLIDAPCGGMFPRVTLPILRSGARHFARAEALANGQGAIDAHALAIDVVTWVTDALSIRARQRPPTLAQVRAMLAVARSIDIEPGADHALPMLASRASMSPFHFLRCFRRVVGTTPHAYVRIARVRQAARLLCDPGTSVTSIAFASGFQDLSAFNQSFRQIVGMTPRQLRGNLRIRSPHV